MTRRALKTAEVTKAKGVDQLCEVGRGSTNSTSSGAALIGYKAGAVKLPLLQHIGVTPRTRVPPLTAAGGDGTEDWWTLLCPLQCAAGKNPDGHRGTIDAEFADVIAHADPGVDQLPHGLPVQIRPPSDRLASILRVLPAAFWSFL